jgi:hypothetical protein
MTTKNKYPGRCVACGKVVEAGCGFLDFRSVHHNIGDPGCPDAGKFIGYTNFPEDRSLIADRFAQGPVYRQHYHGHDVKSIEMPNGDVVSEEIQTEKLT